MLKLNLLPVECRRPHAVVFLSDMRIWQGIGIGLLTLCFLGYGVFLFWYQLTERHYQRLQRELQQVQPLATRYDETRRQLDLWESQLSQIQEQQQERYHWSSLLANINDRLPAEVWLTNFTVRADGNISIKGTSGSLAAIGIFINKLSRLSQLEQVRLVTAAGEGQGDLIGYEIGGRLKPVKHNLVN
jgi:Tfp pilus assembly protein PilN